MKTKVRTVCGLESVSECASQEWGGETHVNRSHAGVHPFMRKRGPSSRNPVLMTWKRPCGKLAGIRERRASLRLVELTSLPALLCIRLFSTSAGAQSVVATVPAANDARTCVAMSSLRLAD